MAQTASNTVLMVADRPMSCIKMAQATDQTTTTDNAPIQVVLASKEIDKGGTDMHGSTSSGGYIEIDTDGVYRLTAMVNCTAADRGGDRNVLIFGTRGTPAPLSDSAMYARFEVTSNNSTTRDTGAWAVENVVSLTDGDRVYLAFVQHARTGSGTANLTIGGSDGSPRPYLIAERIL